MATRDDCRLAQYLHRGKVDQACSPEEDDFLRLDLLVWMLEKDVREGILLLDLTIGASGVEYLFAYEKETT